MTSRKTELQKKNVKKKVIQRSLKSSRPIAHLLYFSVKNQCGLFDRNQGVRNPS